MQPIKKDRKIMKKRENWEFKLHGLRGPRTFYPRLPKSISNNLVIESHPCSIIYTTLTKKKYNMRKNINISPRVLKEPLPKLEINLHIVLIELSSRTSPFSKIVINQIIWSSSRRSKLISHTGELIDGWTVQTLQLFFIL